MTSYIRIPVPEGISPETLRDVLAKAELITETVNPEIPDSFTKGLVLGIQAGDYLEHPYRPEGIKNAMSQADFDRCAKAGFDFYRLPFNASRWASVEGVVPKEQMMLVKSQLDMMQQSLKAVGKAPKVMLDLNHHNNPRKGMRSESITALWPKGTIELTEAQHAKRDTNIVLQFLEFFKDYDNNLAFDLFNEPDYVPATGLGVTVEQLSDWYVEVVRAVRATGSTRTMILEPHGRGSLSDLKIPEGGNVVVSPHNYYPFSYTHQGAMDLTPSMLTDYYVEVLRAKNWGERNGVPIVIGEAGVKNGKNDRDKYIGHIRQVAEELQVPTCLWDYASNFGLYDKAKGDWKSGMLDAIAGKKPKQDYIQPVEMDLSGGRLRNSTAVAGVSYKDGVLTLGPNTGKSDRLIYVTFPGQQFTRYARVIPETVSGVGYEAIPFVAGTKPGQDLLATYTDKEYPGSGYKATDGSGVEFVRKAGGVEVGLQPNSYLGVRIAQKAGDPGVTTRLIGFAK